MTDDWLSDYDLTALLGQIRYVPSKSMLYSLKIDKCSYPTRRQTSNLWMSHLVMWMVSPSICVCVDVKSRRLPEYSYLGREHESRWIANSSETGIQIVVHKCMPSKPTEAAKNNRGQQFHKSCLNRNTMTANTTTNTHRSWHWLSGNCWLLWVAHSRVDLVLWRTLHLNRWHSLCWDSHSWWQHYRHNDNIINTVIATI